MDKTKLLNEIETLLPKMHKELADSLPPHLQDLFCQYLFLATIHVLGPKLYPYGIGDLRQVVNQLNKHYEVDTGK